MSLARRDFLSAVVVSALGAPALTIQSKGIWKAGVATVDITPKSSLWMAGFARRKQAAQGVALPLHAKALALQVDRQAPAVLVTVDLLGVTARSTAHVTRQVQRRHRLQRADLFFNASHTHCGPVVDEQLSVAYGLSSEQWAAIRAYTSWLDETLIRLIDDAISALRPARIEFARGEATFAANRRVKFTPNGPVDHTVPVLRITREDGKPSRRRLRLRVPQHDARRQLRAVPRRLRGRGAGRPGEAASRHHGAVRDRMRGGCESEPARNRGARGGARHRTRRCRRSCARVQ